MTEQNFDDFYLRFYDNKYEFDAKKARLFPSAEKLKVIDEDVTSNIFMAGLVGVKEYCESFFQEMDIKIKSNTRVHAYSQIDFKGQTVSGKKDVPDGMLIITEGNTNPIVKWVALLEFKTKDELRKEQIECYTKIAKDSKHNFDAIITISNDFVSNVKQNPLGFKNTAKLTYYHFSWIRIQTILQYIIQQGINDHDQVYLAEQQLLYMKEHKDIKNFNQMNKEWPEQCKKIRSATYLSIKKHKVTLNAIALDWLQEEQDLGLKLKAKYYKDISVKMTTEETKNLELRIEGIRNLILKNNFVETVYKVNPNKNKDMPYSFSSKKNIEIKNIVYLRRKLQEISFEVIFDKWHKKTLKKQIEYFIKNILRTEPGMMNDVNICVFTKASRNVVSEKTLEKYKSDINRDILYGFKETTPKSEIKKIEVKCSLDLGKEFYSRKGFVSSIESNFENIYSQIVEPFIL